MMTPRGTSLPVRLYTLAVRAFPKEIRDAYGPEMVATFAAAHAVFREQGRRRASRYAWRAAGDALARGLRERWSKGGVGAPPPGTPAGRRADRSRDMFWSQVGTDLRYAFRTLARSPVFTITALLVLALGVGINGAIFTAIEAALLAPLPYPDPGQLVILDLAVATDDPQGSPSDLISGERTPWSRVAAAAGDQPSPPRAIPWSWPKYERLAGAAELPVAAVAAYATRSLTLTGRGDAARLDAEVITPGYFAVLGVDPAPGRALSAAGDEAAAREVILSRSLWQERFGADPEAIGQDVVLNGQTMTVVGVAPAGFAGLSGRARLWVPVHSMPALISPILINGAQAHWLQAIGRLPEGISLEEAQARMDAIARGVDEIAPWDEPGSHITGTARSLAAARRNPRAQRAVLIVAAAAGLVLLIACTNLAALTLARGNDRRRELAVRLALGASRARVARGLLVEALLLAAGGAVLGIGVAALAVRATPLIWPDAFAAGGWNLAFVDATQLSLDGSTLAYTLGVGLLTGLLFGALPALRLSRADLGAAMKEGAGATRRGRGWGLGGRRILVATEIAVALVLLIGAGLMLSSLSRLLDVEAGFDPSRLLVFEYSLPRTSVHAENPAAFHDALLKRLRAMPQVVAAAGGVAPLRGHWTITRMMRAGESEWDPDAAPSIGVQSVTDDYFETLRTPIVRGRTFAASDRADAPPVIVINETAARQFFGDADPLGEPFAIAYGPTSEGVPAQVIGVVADVLYNSPDEGIMAEAYFYQPQAPEGGLEMLVRTRGEPLQMLPDVRAAMAALDPEVPIYDETTAADIATAQVSDTRVVMQLLVAFAAMAVVLATTGIWGVVSYDVVQRRRELGIRMALGARSEQAVGLLVRDGLASAALGIVAGIAAAAALTRYLTALLYEVDPADPTAFAAAGAALLLVALLAAWLPGRQATRIHPAETLRRE
jgi:predicted permease